MIVEQNNVVSIPDMISLRANPAQPLIANTISASGMRLSREDNYVTIIQTAHSGANQNNVKPNRDVMDTLDSTNNLAIAFTERSRDGERNLEMQTDLAYPLTSAEGGNPHSRKISCGTGVRRLTPTECERLQGFPDGWTAGGQSDSSRYRQLGNAVCVPVIEWIGRRIAEQPERN